MRRSLKVKAVATVGIIVATYALYVENRLKDPFYQPGCSASWTGGDCATVFKSSYGHILSHWGIVPKGSLLDLSLPILGLLLYGSYLCAISISRPFPFREELFLSAAIGGGGFSIYLLYVIKVILQEKTADIFFFVPKTTCVATLLFWYLPSWSIEIQRSRKSLTELYGKQDSVN